MPRAKTQPRVVLVEDHQMLRELITPLLTEELGHAPVATVGTLREALEVCERLSPDMVVTDWMLPDGLGLDLVRQQGPRLPDTRWLFISSHENGQVVQEAANLKVQGFVLKQGPLDTLRFAIRAVAEGRTYYCPNCSRVLVEQLVRNGPGGRAVLTVREEEVLRAYAMGENLKQIAANKGMSIRTVQNNMSIIRDKLGLREPAELVQYAVRHGLVHRV